MNAMQTTRENITHCYIHKYHIQLTQEKLITTLSRLKSTHIMYSRRFAL